MNRILKTLRSRRLYLVHLSLASLLVGSVATTAFYAGCGGSGGRLLGRSQNELVRNDKEALAAAQNTQRAFRNISKSVGAAVVSINATQVTTQNPYSEQFQDDFFRHFFGERNRERQQQQKKAPTLGSGFVINEKGYLLTNFHVVKNASEIKVIFPDGREFMAKVVGTDPETDIALLKIEPSGTIPVAPLGDSDEIEIGDWAIAIGNPFGLNGTFTVGVVSAKGRGEQVGAPYQNFIQVDTAINPGNSGGPLVNINGEVIGINSMIYTRTGGSLGIGFAIPVNIAKRVVESILKTGKVDRGYLGIQPGPIDEKMRAVLKLDEKTGVLVNSVLKGGPAEAAGLRDGDVILKINGTLMTSVGHLMRVVAELGIGKTVQIELQREWKKLTVSLTVGQRPGEESITRRDGNRQPEEWLGLKVDAPANLPEAWQQRFGLTGKERGVVVVAAGGKAGEAGFQAGDLITAANYVRIASPAEWTEFVRKNGNAGAFIFQVKRGGQNLFIAVNQ